MHEQIVAEYATWMRSWGASKRTVQVRTDLARSRLREWSGPAGVTPERIAAFLGRETLSAWSRATYHAHLRCLCSWLYATGRLPSDPMLDVRSPRRPKSRPRPLSEAEVKIVLGTAKGRTRDWLLLALLAGLRASEIARVRGEDVTVDGIYVLGKGGKAETLPCHPDLWAMANRYPRRGHWFPGRADGGHIHPQQVSADVSRLFRSLGITGSVHRMRHVYGTRLLRSGVHIRTVQQLMRHANLDTTAAYTAVDEAELRDAILKLTA